MAKNNNLTDFLTDLADAIRAKKGTSAKINPQDFSSEIASISGGGGGGGDTPTPTPTPSDVNFFDYDGTLLYAYTWDKAMAMTELPPLPTQKGLICQEWNYTLEDIKEQNGKCDVGATYITDDGKTRLYIRINTKYGQIPLNFNQTIDGGVTIDWGDGSATQTKSGTGDGVEVYHTYSSAGDYCITLDVAEGCVLGFGKKNSKVGIFGRAGSSGSNPQALMKVEIGKGVEEIKSYAFYKCSFLETISIPQGITAVGEYSFENCVFLRFISLPRGITNIGTTICGSCYSLTMMSIAKGVTSFDSFGNACHALLSAVIPKGVTSVTSNAFNSCYAIKSISIPDGVASIEQYTFNSCYSLESIKMPSTIASIASGAFRDCYRIKLYDFSKHTSVPSLLSSDLFNPISYDCKIVVPDALYDDWKAATNWAKYSANIVKSSEFTE